MTDDVETDSVDIDPELLGELPDGPVEEVPSNIGPSMMDDETIHRWRREATIVAMMETCPYCDRTVQLTRMRMAGDGTATRYSCDSCDESWATKNG